MILDIYSYFLPKKLIAQAPARPRDSSKLLHIKGKELEHLHFRDIDRFFSKGDVLVLNDTKVLANKLVGYKKTGSPAEIIVEGKEKSMYRCRIKTRNPKPGMCLEFPGVNAVIKIQDDDVFWVKFDRPLEPVLKKYGQLPQPTYVEKLKRKDHYQTVIARQKGSLAAPTSALHFTKSLLQKLRKKGVKIVTVTLHISFGTFKPIRTAVEEHKMDKEVFEVSRETADAVNNRTGKLVVCGTTSFKALESAADVKGIVHPIKAASELFIYPGHKFRIKPDMMITNFHFPKSTLILFVAAYFGKDTVLDAYRTAVKKKYRFYSLGDSCLFENSQPQ